MDSYKYHSIEFSGKKEYRITPSHVIIDVDENVIDMGNVFYTS